ncbi:MAG TPA: glycosyltransferase [Pirellulales bacterium]|nr:glycosyltransferase [Pirellulales bacterium]
MTHMDASISHLSPALEYSPTVLAPSTLPPATTKVLHVINGEHYAGAERVQDLLALALPRQGFEAAFACVKPGKFAQARRSQAAPLFELPMRSRVDLSAVRRLAGIVRDGEYALVHTHTPRSALIGRAAARLAGVPAVHHLHSPTASDTTHRFRNWLNAASERLCLSGIDAVIAVSESVGRYGRRIGLSADKVCVVPNGVPIRESLQTRSPPRDTWTLGTVALFRPRKGLEVLLAALAALHSAQLPIRLHAVGSFETPEYEVDVKSLAIRLGVNDLIEWRGFSSQVDAELDKLDLFTLPSLFGEGMPMVILEAMAAGLPVIGTNVEGVPEVVRDGLEGLIVPPGDAQSLARAIERFVTGQVNWTQLRRNAQRRQVERFSEQAMAAGVARVYRRVLG